MKMIMKILDLRHVLIVLTWMSSGVVTYSIEKHLLNAATKAEMFDLFHIMPDGQMQVVGELDMLLTLDQYKALYNDRKPQRSRRYKRKAERNLAKRWPNCRVFYEITESLDTRRDRAIIMEAINEWEKYTCLRFTQSDRVSQRIRFMDGEMCASSVGMQGKAQTLQLASGCRTKGIIAHEIGHAVGWFHEHMRPDRDDYLNVHLSAIPSKYRTNYKKYGTDVINTYGVPYDYTSLMHYGNNAFPGSIETRDPRFQSKIGQRSGLSFKDIKLANVMYQCAKEMNCVEKKCDDGFQLYKSHKGEQACQCWCDSGHIEDPLVLCSKRNLRPIPPVFTLPPPTSEPPMECVDVRHDCKEMKSLGKCMTKMEMMMANCAKTCDFCGKGKDLCMDYEVGCGLMSGHCNDPGLKSTMSEVCMASCDLCQSPPDPCEIMHEMMGENHPNSKGTPTLRRRDSVMSVFLSVCVVWISVLSMGE